MCGSVVVFLCREMMEESERSRVVVLDDECDGGHCRESGRIF